MLHALRLRPGDDLYLSLAQWTKDQALPAAAIVTCVGSLTEATLRLAGATETRRLTGPFEIVSLVGTLAPTGLHLHIAISDADGRCTGGHLKPGSLIHTTAELVITELPGLRFDRAPDPETGYPELTISKR
jgi:predicted DNA-binding protein with PD1-like motif